MGIGDKVVIASCTSASCPAGNMRALVGEEGVIVRQYGPDKPRWYVQFTSPGTMQVMRMSGYAIDKWNWHESDLRVIDS